MISRKARIGFHRMLRFGCFTGVLPYKWNPKTGTLAPTSFFRRRLFTIHQTIVFSYTVRGWIRFFMTQTRGEFPLFQKVLTTAWSMAFFITSVGLFQLGQNREDIMTFANRTLAKVSRKFHAKSDTGKDHIQLEGEKMLSWHMYIGLFLLFTNPLVHSFITEPSPCAPYFISSSYFSCGAIDENIVTFLEKLPFLLFELYTISMFLYICSFFWSFILMGLGEVFIELKRIKFGLLELVSKPPSYFLREYSKLEVLVVNLNSSFLYFLMAFPSSLFFIMATLMFGSIRLWHQDPQQNLMFPLCGARCGFEAVTPLQMAGNVNKASARLLDSWGDLEHYILKRQNGRGRKILRLYRRSCHVMRCSAGSLYTFENSIVLCSINNCILLTLNMLVSFK